MQTCQKNTQANQKGGLIPLLSNCLRLTKFNEKEKSLVLPKKQAAYMYI